MFIEVIALSNIYVVKEANISNKRNRLANPK